MSVKSKLNKARAEESRGRRDNGVGVIYDRCDSVGRESAARNSTYLLGADEEWTSRVSACAGRVGSRAQWGAPAQGVSVALTLWAGAANATLPAEGCPRPQRRRSPPQAAAHSAKRSRRRLPLLDTDHTNNDPSAESAALLQKR